MSTGLLDTHFKSSMDHAVQSRTEQTIKNLTVTGILFIRKEGCNKYLAIPQMKIVYPLKYEF